MPRDYSRLVLREVGTGRTHVISRRGHMEVIDGIRFAHGQNMHLMSVRHLRNFAPKEPSTIVAILSGDAPVLKR